MSIGRCAVICHGLENGQRATKTTALHTTYTATCLTLSCLLGGHSSSWPSVISYHHQHECYHYLCSRHLVHFCLFQQHSVVPKKLVGKVVPCDWMGSPHNHGRRHEMPSMHRVICQTKQHHTVSHESGLFNDMDQP